MNANSIDKLREHIQNSDAVLIGAGAGLSSSAGLTYSGDRFYKYFSDFHEKYGIGDMYTGGFYPFSSLEEYWAWWSRHIMCNRYEQSPLTVYTELLSLVRDKNYFVITTNVDHCFRRVGFDKTRLFYTQGDYGLFQCSTPCHSKTYDNEEVVRRMAAEQSDMKIPTELIPRCPKCGKPMTVNLRVDDTFVQDDGWYVAKRRYDKFLRDYGNSRILLLELGVGCNTPGIIKYPFWRMALNNDKATYGCVNSGEAFAPREIEHRSICINGDIGETVLNMIKGAV